MFLKIYRLQTVTLISPRAAIAKALFKPKERKFLLMELKILFHRTQARARNFFCKIYFWNIFILKLWPLLSLKPALAKVKSTKLKTSVWAFLTFNKTIILFETGNYVFAKLLRLDSKLKTKNHLKKILFSSCDLWSFEKA